MDTPVDTRLALLWDIDGVLNPHKVDPDTPLPGYDTHLLRPDGLTDDDRYVKSPQVRLNPTHGPQILALAADLAAENWWATTWRAEANNLIGPLLGLPELPTLLLDVPTTHPDGKWPHVLAAFPDRPVIWFDDDFNKPWSIERRDRFLAARGATPTLLRWIDPRVGLREEDFAAAREWARAHGLDPAQPTSAR